MENKICKKCNGSGKRWGLKFAGGSMGLSLPAAVGFALAKKMKHEEGTVYVLMSDGEQAIGTTYESALIAAYHKLDNLCVLVDYNKFCAMGKTNEILAIEPLRKKWESFGWVVRRCSGHDYEQLEECLKDIHRDVPTVIIADTVKGKGVSFMENNNNYHYLHVSDEDYEKAKKELNA